MWLYWRFVFWCLQHIYRVTLIAVFLGHFRINLHKLARSILMRDRNTGTQSNFKKRFLNVDFIAEKTVLLAFFRGVSSKFAAVSKINKWRQGHLSYGHVIRWATVTWYAYIFAGYDDYFVFFGDRYCCMLLRIITRLHGSVTSVVRVTPHTKRGAYSIVNGDRCSASHYNYQNRIRSVRIFANCLSIVQY